MDLTGGYDIMLEGKPSSDIVKLPDTAILHIPLSSPRFGFSRVDVEDGQKVEKGQALAADPRNYSLPLLAPLAGTVRLDSAPGHITLEDIGKDGDSATGRSGGGNERDALLGLGAWQFFFEANTRRLPDPLGKPKAVIVSTFHLDSFAARGDVLLNGQVPAFVRGLGRIHSLAGCDVNLALPRMPLSPLAREIWEATAECEWLNVVPIPLKYPYDNFQILSRYLDLDAVDREVWAVAVEGVMAVEKALGASRPAVSRVISIGGPGVKKAVHVNAVTGYPIKTVVETYASGSPMRVIEGGVLSGTMVTDAQKGISCECIGLTLLPENTKREVLAFAHPGLTKHSYTRAFAGIVRPFFRECYTTAVRGEPRPCISCGTCEAVCPARILPYMLHRYLAKDRLKEAAKRLRVDRCVRCGLCTYVCPSKIEHRKEHIEAQEKLMAAASAPGDGM